MALSLDDQILGEKVNNYCSSSEDENDDNDIDSGRFYGDDDSSKKSSDAPDPSAASAPRKGSYNTGPKGVIEDWREYKRLEAEHKEGQEKERQVLLNKLSMTCRSHLDDEKEKESDEKFFQELEDLEDEFMLEYRRKKMEEMRKSFDAMPKFGTVVQLYAENYVEAIDKEKPQVTVIVHIYVDSFSPCTAMSHCLDELAQEYQMIKFCKINASEAKMSFKFRETAVPALLIYKNGDVLGNFIRLGDDFGDAFYPSDVESFLSEHGFLPEKMYMGSAIQDKTTSEIRSRLPQDDDADSDFELD